MRKTSSRFTGMAALLGLTLVGCQAETGKTVLARHQAALADRLARLEALAPVIAALPTDATRPCPQGGPPPFESLVRLQPEDLAAAPARPALRLVDGSWLPGLRRLAAQGLLTRGNLVIDVRAERRPEELRALEAEVRRFAALRQLLVVRILDASPGVRPEGGGRPELEVTGQALVFDLDRAPDPLLFAFPFAVRAPAGRPAELLEATAAALASAYGAACK